MNELDVDDWHGRLTSRELARGYHCVRQGAMLPARPVEQRVSGLNSRSD